MNVFEQKLSAIEVGTPVRLTQLNGQIIEGVVTENDKSNAISVTITANVTLRYSQIAGIEQNNALGISGQTVVPAAIAVPEIAKPESVKPTEEKQISEPAPEEKTPKVKVHNPEADMMAAFKAMDNDAKKRLNAVKGKIDSALKNHDSSKLHEAINTCWDAMEEHGYERNPDVNRYYAYICILGEEYKNAAISFYFANDVKNAYRAAFEGAANMDSAKLYTLAAAYASLFIADPDSEYIEESVEVLMYSSGKCNDITGLEYIVSKQPSSEARKLLNDVFIGLADKVSQTLKEPSDHKKCIEALREHYNNQKVIKEIRQYEPKEESKPEPISAPEEPVSKPAEPVRDVMYGNITKYKFYEDSGTITDLSGKTLPFNVNDISDSILKTMLKSVAKWDNDRPIPVKFKVGRKMSRDCAVDIIRTNELRPASNFSSELKRANSKYSSGDHAGALAIYKRYFDTPHMDDIFPTVVMCYNALQKKDAYAGYDTELEEFIEKYKDNISRTSRNLYILQQFYMERQDFDSSLDILNELTELCDSSEHGTMLQYLQSKAICYKKRNDYPSAISQLNDWLEIVKRNRLTDRFKTRDSSVYPELAELYLKNGDIRNAEKYALETKGADDRRDSILSKIEELKNPQEEPEEEILDDIDDDADDDATSITLQEAYDAYSDDADPERLVSGDSDAVEKISIFNEKQLYALVTWLTVAAALSKKANSDRVSELAPELSAGQAVRSINDAFGYAYQHPLAECEYVSTQVLSLYETSRRIIPQYNDGLMTSAILRTLFAPSSTLDYYLDDLILVIEDSEMADKYPVLVNLLTAMKSFYESTGCAIDAFAGYRSNANVIDDIIAEANEIRLAVDQRNLVFESQGQVRRLREFMFSDEQSELRRCLDITADNKASEFGYVRSTIQRLFIRRDRPITTDNIDPFKLDEYIDGYWDKARDVILSEGRHISRPHDKIKGSKRNNIINSIKKIISCVCDWLAVAEHAGNQDDAYIKQNYEAAAPQIISMLEELLSASKHDLKENGFNWGVDSIRYTADELLSKMNGSYNAKSRKYFFIGFLSGEDVLLNDDHLPELQSTFCGWGRMSLLSRIERHASEQHLSFEERIAEILSDAETKHNFRTARLIKEYAEDTGNKALAELKEFEQLNACMKLAKKRFETMYEEFSTEISLYESYGMISDINGEKSAILKLALDWFRITRITADYGFYSRMLDYIKLHISNNAAERGQQLQRQLEELADKPEYDFGVYTKEMIAGLINDQNFTSAEFILNCIRRHDTKEVHDYSIEPFGYFNEFVSEHATNYRAVFCAGKNIVDTIAEYSRKRDMELALKHLTNNARKETKGGADMLYSWPKRTPVNMDDLRRLLTKLGFEPKSITPEDDSGIESYKVYCRKRCGKVTYPHTIPAFGSLTETEGFRVMCLYGKFDCNSLMNKFRTVNTTAKHTLVLLDYSLNMEERRRLARKIKEEKTFSKTFIVIDRVILFYLAKHYAPDDTIVKRFMAVTLPFAYYQPFVEKSSDTMPPELFTGREAELTSIESPEGANLVYGGRQLGKSALLKMAQRNIDKNGNNDRALLVEVKGMHYRDAALLISQKLIINDILPDGCETNDWNTLANHIEKRLKDDDPETRINYLLLMLDEADEFIKTSAADDNPPITAIKNLPSSRFKLVMAGLHNLSRFNRNILIGKNSTLMHFGSVIVKQFQRPEAIKLLTNTLAYLGFRFNENVISLILAKTNYYPGLIQFYCQKLLEAMKEEDYAGYSESNTPYYEVNEGHIKKVLSDPAFMDKVNEKLRASLFTEEEDHSNHHIFALIFAYLYYVSPTEKKYRIDELMKIANEYTLTRVIALGKENVEELLNEMCDLNILSKEDDYYRFATEGFRELLGSSDKVWEEMSKYSKEGQE